MLQNRTLIARLFAIVMDHKYQTRNLFQKLGIGKLECPLLSAWKEQYCFSVDNCHDHDDMRMASAATYFLSFKYRHDLWMGWNDPGTKNLVRLVEDYIPGKVTFISDNVYQI